jgi:putative transcriptional regulator
LHLIHRIPNLLGGVEINPGLFWGGTYEDLASMSASHKFRKDNIRLFSGYAGWDAGQLEEELQQGSWIVANALPEIIFEVAATDTWSSSLQTLGPNFAYLANLPLHPQMN